MPLKSRLFTLLLAFHLLTTFPRLTRAEDSATYKYEDSQEDNDRFRMEAHYLRADLEFGLNTKLGITGLVDTITGSTPTGVPIQEEGDPNLQTSYRFFSDDSGIDSHTASLEWFQKLGELVILRPVYHYYRQWAADFYYYDLDKSSVVSDRDHAGTAPFYSSDHRLSKMETHTYGLKLICFVNDDWEFNVKFNRYKMKGLDGINHFSAYSDANILTTGLRLWL